MKIIVVASDTKSLVGFRLPFIEALSKAGHLVTVVGPTQQPEVTAKLDKIGVKFKKVELERASISPLSDIKYIYKLFLLFRSLKPDMVFSYTMKPAQFASFAAWLARVPSIYSMLTGLGYSFTSNSKQAKIISSIIKLMSIVCLRRCNKVIFHNSDDLELMVTKGVLHENKCEVVNGSGVDIDEFRQAKPPEEISFLFIGRLIKDKGIVEYLNAAKKLKEDYANIQCKVAGGLDENPNSITKLELDKLVENGVVDYLGTIEDVRPIIASSSVFVLPSYREGRSRSILEAMAMGRAIITTDAPGCRQTIENGTNGVLCKAADSVSLHSAMKYFIDHPEQIIKMGRCSREIAVREYDVHKVNRRMMDIIGA